MSHAGGREKDPDGDDFAYDECRDGNETELAT